MLFLTVPRRKQRKCTLADEQSGVALDNGTAFWDILVDSHAVLGSAATQISPEPLKYHANE